MDENFDKFVEMIRPFQTLWRSARITCIAVRNSVGWASVVTRIVLRDVDLPKSQRFRAAEWLDPTPCFLAAVLDVAKSEATQIIYRAVANYVVHLENNSTIVDAPLRWPLANAQPPRDSEFRWNPPMRYQRTHALRFFGEGRSSVALLGSGGNVQEVLPYDLQRDVSSKLRLHSYYDGIEGLCERLVPGWQPGQHNRAAEVVFPLPFDIKQNESGMLVVRLPKSAAENQVRVRIFSKPGNSVTELSVAPQLRQPSPDGTGVEWRWDIGWPKGAESGTASLFYSGEEIDSAELLRWPAAATLRAAVDSHFDADHKRLRGVLLGDNVKHRSSKALDFETAVVRLMNLLGIPLVWYGKGVSPGLNDAAGLVVKGEERVVVLAECTVEKPEIKFSSLKDRAEELGRFLQNEAEVLPVVFTQSDPPESVFEAAADHGISLVGRSELKSLFDMLSGRHSAPKNALAFLTGIRARFPGIRSLPGIR